MILCISFYVHMDYVGSYFIDFRGMDIGIFPSKTTQNCQF